MGREAKLSWSSISLNLVLVVVVGSRFPVALSLRKICWGGSKHVSPRPGQRFRN